MKIRLFLCMLIGLWLHGGAAGAGSEAANFSDTPELTLREALIRGVENNLDIKVKKSDVYIAGQNVILNQSAFDPLVDASVAVSESQTPTNYSSYGGDFSEDRRKEGSAGISKKLEMGTRGKLSARTNRAVTNSSTTDLQPEYRDSLVLEITQPLLKDFGPSVNTSDVRVAENQKEQAKLLYFAQINEIVKIIEITYYELAKAVQALEYRIESRELALTLLEGNRKKFASGVVPISEVQSAETIVASRDEQILYARQQVEVISDQLKDLLNLQSDDPLYAMLIVPEKIVKTEGTYPAMDTALEIALVNRPELQAQRLEIQNRDIKLAYYKNQKLPRVDLSGTFGVNGLSGEYKPVYSSVPPSEYDGNYGDAFSSMMDRDGYSWRAGINVVYPLGNRAAKTLYSLTREGKQQAIYRYKRIESRTETGVKNAMVNANRSMERLFVAETFESLAAVSLDQEMKRLSEGLSDTFRIVTFQANLIEAKIRKITALVDYHKGLSDLYYNMGTILERHHMTAKLNTEETTGHEK
ncbi:MAG: TolC family protein [Proteobacteria bacterium]|nr:TolC family protein [Pseudomonadota bacterium]MBU4469298.1 TolC family protein [Pseudomonadota bacterium]MCG2750777.1 TolC family protein [Desulfobacteraceae bacterium]